MNRRILALTVSSLLGCLSLYWLPAKAVGPLSEQTIRLLQPVQPAILTVLCLWLGARYGKRVGLGFLSDQAVRTSSRSMLFARWAAIGVMAGLVPWFLFKVFEPALPSAFLEAAPAHDPPLLVRLLYGGITEEVLVRWGLMSWLAWLVARFSRQSEHRERRARWAAMVVASLLFGAGHLPYAFHVAGRPDGVLAVYIVLANLPVGLAAGSAFILGGIELAMLTHAVAGALLAVLG
jgi:membrane protease YdiL (CAAX protease family)